MAGVAAGASSAVGLRAHDLAQPETLPGARIAPVPLFERGCRAQRVPVRAHDQGLAPGPLRDSGPEGKQAADAGVLQHASTQDTLAPLPYLSVSLISIRRLRARASGVPAGSMGWNSP